MMKPKRKIIVLVVGLLIILIMISVAAVKITLHITGYVGSNSDVG